MAVALPSALLIGLSLMGAIKRAEAASAAGPPKLALLQMHVVTSNDPSCAQKCSQWIALDGPIGIGSAARFRQLLTSLGPSRLPVLINSVGGSVADAIAIGSLIRSKHLDVAVTRTILTSCPADRAACEKLVPHGVTTGRSAEIPAICASACSFILAGGERRFVSFHDHVGVHQFRSFRTMTQVVRTYRILKRDVNGVRSEVSRTLVAEHPISSRIVSVATTNAQYQSAQRYLARMGITPSLMSLAEATEPQSIHWLTPAELVTTKMLTDSESGAQLIAPRTPGRTTTQDQPQTAAASSVAEEAELMGDDPSARPSLHIAGQVNWAISTGLPDPTMVVVVTLPEGMGNATIRIADRGTQAGKPDYRLAFTLRPGPKVPFQSVIAVGQPMVRASLASPAIELASEVGPPSLGTYDIDLKAQATGGTIAEFENAAVWEFPVIGMPWERYRLVITRDASSGEVLRHWRALLDAKHAAS